MHALRLVALIIVVVSSEQETCSSSTCIHLDSCLGVCDLENTNCELSWDLEHVGRSVEEMSEEEKIKLADEDKIAKNECLIEKYECREACAWNFRNLYDKCEDGPILSFLAVVAVGVVIYAFINMILWFRKNPQPPKPLKTLREWRQARSKKARTSTPTTSTLETDEPTQT